MNRSQMRDRIHDLEDELRHKDRLHAALLDGHDSQLKEVHGARLAADVLAAENDRLDNTLRAAGNLADELAASTSSAYRKAGRRLAEILGGGPEKEQEAAS